MKRRSIFADRLNAFDFAFGDEAVTKHRGQWRAFFKSRADSRLVPAPLSQSPHLILELGCFDASFLLRIAQKHPAANLIGLDWKARPLYLGAEKIAALNVTNLALLRARAQDLATMFADGELDEIWLFQPEPCDRENERQNRLMKESFLLDVHRVLRDRASLILKTDHPEYFQSTRELVGTPALSKRFEIACESADFWNDSAAIASASTRAFAGEKTFYECRFVRRRQPIRYLQLQKRQQDSVDDRLGP